MEAKQHISRVKSMQHAGLCIETRTTIKQLHDNTQSHIGSYREEEKEKGNNGSHYFLQSFTLVFAIMAEPLHLAGDTPFVH